MKAAGIAAIIAIVFTFVLAFYSFFVLEQIVEIPMDAKIDDSIGFNSGKDALHFGTCLPNGESSRKIMVMNNRNYPIRLRIFNTGNLSSWVSISENNFIVPAGKNTSVTYKISPENAILGAYSGKSKVIIERAYSPLSII